MRYTSAWLHCVYRHVFPLLLVSAQGLRQNSMQDSMGLAAEGAIDLLLDVLDRHRTESLPLCARASPACRRPGQARLTRAIQLRLRDSAPLMCVAGDSEATRSVLSDSPFLFHTGHYDRLCLRIARLYLFATPSFTTVPVK